VGTREDRRGQASCGDFLCHLDETAVSVKRHTTTIVSSAFRFIAQLVFIDIPSHNPSVFLPLVPAPPMRVDLQGTLDFAAAAEGASAKLNSSVHRETDAPQTSVRPAPLSIAECHPPRGEAHHSVYPVSIPPWWNFRDAKLLIMHTKGCGTKGQEYLDCAARPYRILNRTP